MDLVDWNIGDGNQEENRGREERVGGVDADAGSDIYRILAE